MAGNPKGWRVVVRGWGLVSPLGLSAWDTYSALLAGRGIADRAAAMSLETLPADLVRACGCVSSAQHDAHDPAIALAERAAREALFAVSSKALPSPVGEMDAYLGASKGAVTALSAAADQLSPGHGQARRTGPGATTCAAPPPVDALAALALGPHAYLSRHLRQRLGLGQVHGVVAACASSLTALHMARLELLRRIENAEARSNPSQRRMLVISAEAALIPLFIHSYRRLGVLAQPTPASYRGRPLDRQRRGFMLSELGAAVLLEATDQTRAREVELLDTAVAGEAYDVIRPAPVMPALQHVAQRLLEGRSVDLLHPHATGTLDQDEAEMQVYSSLVRNPSAVDVYACKGALGHGLGTAGLVSLILACLCAQAGRRPPMPWLKEPIPTVFPLDSQARTLPKINSTHAIFASGFGGHVAGAVLQWRG